MSEVAPPQSPTAQWFRYAGYAFLVIAVVGGFLFSRIVGDLSGELGGLLAGGAVLVLAGTQSLICMAVSEGLTRGAQIVWLLASPDQREALFPAKQTYEEYLREMQDMENDDNKS
ncbi:MAG: hypothetical protein NXI03_04885, partial [Alphaproteobacteria bacterium]|uniref:hypothetical protein n=1 Tax=Maricaulis alexandrii TaxID=2570354 RepID=UPI0011095529|nr:hypothetical protein [Maricaulis alexandrii]MCR9266886.1 hypothetical protein [Alphaproteobacteria bacterium]